MTLLSEIITDAYRETNLIALGTTPKPAQTAEALRRLQGLITGVYGNDAGENLNDWPLGPYGRQNQSFLSGPGLLRPAINSRLLATALMACTVYLPVQPSDGSRMQILDPFNRLSTYPIMLDGNGRAIENATSILLNADGLNRVWFYRADLGNWVRITELTETDEMPFPVEYDDYFVTMTAMRINPRYGKNLAQETVARLKDIKQQLTSQYLQSAPLQIPWDLSYPTQQSYDNFARGNIPGASTADFDQGYWPW